MSMIKEIDQRLKAAMLAKDAALTSTLRLIKNDLSKEADRRNQELTPEMEQTTLKTMAKQRRDSIEQFRQGGRVDLAEKEEAELKIIEGFLPKAISAEQIEAVIEKTFAELAPVDPAKSGALIGKVMSELKATGLSFDGKSVSELVRKRLGG